MFRNQLQTGLISILCGSGLDPLEPWAVQGRCIRRVLDEDVPTLVYDLSAVQFCTTHISLPFSRKQSVGIRLPCLTMLVKNMRRPFCFEFQVLDDRLSRRRFRASNCRPRASVSPLLCHMPLALDDGWNKIQIDLDALTRRTYGSRFLEFVSMQVFANCRIRRIYFSDRWYDQDELPDDYQLRRRPSHQGARRQPTE